MMYEKLWSECYKCTKKRKKCIFYRTESVAMTPKSCAHMRTTSLWESLQNGQLELRRWSWYLARITNKDTAVSVWACQAGFWKNIRTSCQQQNCQNWQYGLVSKPFSSPHMIMCQSAFCIAMSRLKCLVWSVFFCFSFFSLCRLIKHDWSMTELRWSWISLFFLFLFFVPR